MELGFTIDYIRKSRGTEALLPLKDAAKLCADAGFIYLDYTPDFTAENWEEQAHRDREVLDSFGLCVEQSHAPFNRYGAYPDELFWKMFKRSFRAAQIVGARHMVVHADEYRTVDHWDEKEIQDYSYDYLASCAEFCKRHSMKLAIENVFEDNARRCKPIDGKSRFGSRVEELVRLIDRFADPNVGCCWDFGHARCAYGDDQQEAMKYTGHRIICTHVHDNYYDKDLHLLPFSGKTDWEGHMKALKEMKYSGKLSFELVYGAYPEEMKPLIMELIYKTGIELLDMYNEA